MRFPLAAKIVFFGRYGVVMAREADGFIKAGQTIEASWMDALVKAGVIDSEAREHLTTKRLSLLSITANDLMVPQEWLDIDEDFGTRLARQLNKTLSGGQVEHHLQALGEVLEKMWALVDHWMGADWATSTLADEAELQKRVRSLLEMAKVKVSEGQAVGGGKLDLHLNESVILENKIEGSVREPNDAKPAAGMQGRRYAIALNRQVVLVVMGYECGPGQMQSKTKSVTVHPIAENGSEHVEIRFALPYGAPTPSREKAAAGRA